MKKVLSLILTLVMVLSMAVVGANAEAAQEIVYSLYSEPDGIDPSVTKNDRLAPTVFNETTGIRYELHGDYYFPVLLVPEQENSEPIGKWGLMHRKYLEEHHPGQYTHLLLSGRLMDRLREIDKQSTERFDTLMDGYSKEWNITEALKAEDPMRWVQLMNNAKAAAEWSITMEIVCC